MQRLVQRLGRGSFKEERSRTRPRKLDGLVNTKVVVCRTPHPRGTDLETCSRLCCSKKWEQETRLPWRMRCHGRHPSCACLRRHRASGAPPLQAPFPLPTWQVASHKQSHLANPLFFLNLATILHTRPPEEAVCPRRALSPPSPATAAAPAANTSLQQTTKMQALLVRRQTDSAPAHVGERRSQGSGGPPVSCHRKKKGRLRDIQRRWGGSIC